MDPTGELTEPTRELTDPIFLPTVDPTVDPSTEHIVDPTREATEPTAYPTTDSTFHPTIYDNAKSSQRLNTSLFTINSINLNERARSLCRVSNTSLDTLTICSLA